MRSIRSLTILLFFFVILFNSVAIRAYAQTIDGRSVIAADKPKVGCCIASSGLRYEDGFYTLVRYDDAPSGTIIKLLGKPI